MGRPKKNPTLEEQIEMAQKKLAKYAGPYKAAVEELSALLDQRDNVREDLLLEAVRKSNRSYDEIMEFIQSNPDDDEWYEPGQGF